MKMNYLTHTRGEEHFTNVKCYSCPGSVWLEHKSSIYIIVPAPMQPAVWGTAEQFPTVTSRGCW